jgi:hypothetical protein
MSFLALERGCNVGASDPGWLYIPDARLMLDQLGGLTPPKKGK